MHFCKAAEKFEKLRAGNGCMIMIYSESKTPKQVKLLTEWRNFAKVIDKARIACKNSGYGIGDHFAEVSKMVEAGVAKTN